MHNHLTTHVCRRIEGSRPKQDIDLNSCSPTRRGRAPGLGWRAQVRVVDGSGPTERSVDSAVSQLLRLTWANPIKRGREIERYFQSSIIGHGAFQYHQNQKPVNQELKANCDGKCGIEITTIPDYLYDTIFDMKECALDRHIEVRWTRIDNLIQQKLKRYAVTVEPHHHYHLHSWIVQISKNL